MNFDQKRREQVIFTTKGPTIGQIKHQFEGLKAAMRLFGQVIADYETNEPQVELPKPCMGEAFSNWHEEQYAAKVGEEYGEMVKAYREWTLADNRTEQEKFESLMRECTDLIVATTSFMEKMGADFERRQRYLAEVNRSNAKRDGGRRIRHDRQ